MKNPLKYWHTNGYAGLVSLRECYVLVDSELHKMYLAITDSGGFVYKYKNIRVPYRKLLKSGLPQPERTALVGDS